VWADAMNTGLVNSLTALLVGAALSFLAARYWWARAERRDRAAHLAIEHARLLARVAELENKVGLVSQAVLPISTAFQAILIKELTHFHTPVLDALLAKLGPPFLLTPEEERALLHELRQRERDMGPMITEPEREAAQILPIVMKRAKAEAEMSLIRPAIAVEFKLISVPQATEDAPPTVTPGQGQP